MTKHGRASREARPCSSLPLVVSRNAHPCFNLSSTSVLFCLHRHAFISPNWSSNTPVLSSSKHTCVVYAVRRCFAKITSSLTCLLNYYVWLCRGRRPLHLGPHSIWPGARAVPRPSLWCHNLVYWRISYGTTGWARDTSVSLERLIRMSYIM